MANNIQAFNNNNVSQQNNNKKNNDIPSAQSQLATKVDSSAPQTLRELPSHNNNNNNSSGAERPRTIVRTETEIVIKTDDKKNSKPSLLDRIHIVGKDDKIKKFTFKPNRTSNSNSNTLASPRNNNNENINKNNHPIDRETSAAINKRDALDQASSLKFSGDPNTRYIQLNVGTLSISTEEEREILIQISKNPDEKSTIRVECKGRSFMVKKQQPSTQKNTITKFSVELVTGKLGGGGNGTVVGVMTASSPDIEQATKITVGDSVLSLQNEDHILRAIESRLEKKFKKSKANAEFGFQHVYKEIYNYSDGQCDFTAGKTIKYTGDCEGLLGKSSFLSDEMRLDICNQFVRAAWTMRDIGILHKDLKPANIFYLGQDLKIFISDFGSASVQDEMREKILTNRKAFDSECKEEEYFQGKITLRLVSMIDCSAMYNAYKTVRAAALEYQNTTTDKEEKLNIFEKEMQQYLLHQEKFDDFTMGICLYYFLTGNMPFKSPIIGPGEPLKPQTWKPLAEKYDSQTVELVKGLLYIGNDFTQKRLSISEVAMHWNPQIIEKS